MKITGKQLTELHEKLLEILKFFKKYCNENELRFFLAFGSCLGAVRDKGFIPWDDDVDIIMPPEDYKKLKALWKPGEVIEHYTLCDSTNNYCDGHLELTIRDNETTYITNGDLNLDTHHGIMVEITPLSYSPDNLLLRYWQTINACIYAIYRVQRTPNTGGFIQKSITKLALRLVPRKEKRYATWKKAEKYILTLPSKKSNYFRVFGQFHTLKRYYPIELFEEVVWLPFEDTEMPVPVGYKEYLTLLYGEYIIPPPKEKQIPDHEVIFLDCNNSYIKYRGEKYLNDNK